MTPNTIKRRRVTVGRTKESLRAIAQKNSVDIKTDRDHDMDNSNAEKIEFVYEGSPLPDPKPDQSNRNLSRAANEQNETVNFDTSSKKSPTVRHMFAFSGLTAEDKAKCIEIVKERVIDDNFCTIICTYRVHEHIFDSILESECRIF